MNTQRENRGDPMLSPKAAPGLNTSVHRNTSPTTARGKCRGSAVLAHSFVTKSSATMTSRTGQNSVPLLLRIFLPLLAIDAVPRVRQRIQPFEGDVVPALMTLAETLRGAVQPSERFIDVPE